MLQSNGLKGRISAKESITAKLNNKEVQVYPELEDLTVTPSAEEQHFKSEKYGYDNVTVKAVESKEIAIVPSVEEQVKEGIFNKVTVAGDSNLISENIKEGTEIFGVHGVAKTSGETLNIKPTEEEQSYNGLYSQVNVDKINTEEVIADVDFSASDIVEINPTEGTYIKKAIINKDINLIAENIKEGAEIFGIRGVSKTTNAKMTNGSYLFYNNARLDYVDDILKLCDNITGMNYMFYNCSNLTNLDLSNLNTSNVTDMGYMFYNCSNLKELELNNFNTSNVTNMSNMFYECSSLTNLDLSSFDMSKVINVDTMFINCSNLINLQFGFNLGKGYTSTLTNYRYYTLRLTNCTSISYESLMSVINNLYDLNLTYDVANGGKLYAQSLTLGTTNKSKLTEEEIAIATSKGWNVS